MHGKRKWLPGWQRVELVELCLDRGASRRQAAAWRRVSVATVQYWVERYRAASDQERASGAWAQDRSCRPHHQPARVSDEVHDRVCEVRTRTGWGPRLIASELGMAHATVSRCLARRGLSRMPAPDREHVRRFEWPCPGDLLQIDTKRLARFSRPGHKLTGDRYRTGAEKRMKVGWEFCHSLDHRRSHSTGLHRDPPRRAGRDRHRLCRARAVVLRRPRHHRQATANRQCLDLHPQPLLRELLTEHGIEHRRIPPRTPKRNGKIERYQQTLAREWAYGQRYRNSHARAAASRSGSTTTTSTATTARSATGHPSAAFRTTRGTTARPSAPSASGGARRRGCRALPPRHEPRRARAGARRRALI